MITTKKIKELKNNARAEVGVFYQTYSAYFQGNNKRPGQYQDASFLYIRADEADIGDRPIAGVFWNSPDIELYDNTGSAIATNEMIAGRPYTVEVTVNNGGDADVSSCNVELYICDPTLGFSQSSSTLLGTQAIPVLGQNRNKARFSVTATPSFVGHRCLFGRVHSLLHREIPLSFKVFDTVNDRHIGQQNLSIIGQAELLSMNFVLAGDKTSDNLTVTITPIANLPEQLKRIKSLGNLQFSVNQNFLNQAVDQFSILPRDLKTNLFKHKQSLQQFSKPSLAQKFKLPPTLDSSVLLKGSKGSWGFELLRGVQPVYLGVPKMGLQRGQAAAFYVEMTGVQKQKIGGITLIVKS